VVPGDTLLLVTLDRDPRLIEELAENAWPALVVQVVDGWRVRVTPKVKARRSSSVLPLAGRDAVGLEERLTLVDEFYARWGEPVRYQLSPGAHPADLDSILEGRGFDVEAPVHVQTAPIDGVLAVDDGGHDVDVHEDPSGPWLSTYTDLYRRGDAESIRRTIFGRIGPPVGYALLRIDDTPAAVGMGVLERGWLGIFSMGTQEEFRRQGAAAAVLKALATWAQSHGATNAYLQVEAQNASAHRLYARAGFQTLYEYHYRLRPVAK
jgi:N-acetylglutamate synthase